MKKALILAVAVLSMASLTGCGEKKEKTPAEALEEIVQSKDKSEMTAEETLAYTFLENVAEAAKGGKYNVEFLGAEKAVNAENENIAVVTYKFTNTSGQTTTADAAISFTAFQDGIEVKQHYGDDIWSGNHTKKIQDGASIECQVEFALESDSDLEVEAHGVWSSDSFNHTFKM